jgi:hypothetical protein
MMSRGEPRGERDVAAPPARVGLQRPAGSRAAPVVGRSRGSSTVLDLQRTVGNRAVAAILQREITDEPLAKRVRETATQLAAATELAGPIAQDRAEVAARKVIADHANDTPWEVIEAALRAALVARHVLAVLRDAQVGVSGQVTYGTNAPRLYAAAGDALAQVSALAADPDKVIECMTKMSWGLGLQFPRNVQLATVGSGAVKRRGAEAELAQTMSGHAALAGIPASEAWKLLMDADKQQERGAYGFENERGYMAGMMRGLKVMLDTLDEPFTAELYENLHDAAIEGVSQRGTGEAFEKRYRTVAVQFGGVLGKTFTIDGLGRLRKASEWTDWFSIEESQDEFKQDIVTVKHLKKTAEECAKRVTAIIERYNKEIVEVEGKDAKLTAILKCCQDLELAHTFTDGNLRTTAFLVLNRLLIQNGMSPTVLGEPNNLDGHTIEQLIPQVLEGQKRVQALQSREGQERVGALEQILV